MERVVNNTLQPVVLENGAVIPAAGTPEARPIDAELTEKDHRRHVATGRLSIIEAQESQPASGDTTGAPPSPPIQTAAETKSKSEKARQS